MSSCTNTGSDAQMSPRLAYFFYNLFCMPDVQLLLTLTGALLLQGDLSAQPVASKQDTENKRHLEAVRIQVFSKVLFTPSLPCASLSFILSFSIRHRNFVLQFSSAFSTRSVLVPLLKPPIFFPILSASRSFQLAKTMCSILTSQTVITPHLDICSNSLLPMDTCFAPDTAAHLSKPHSASSSPVFLNSLSSTGRSDSIIASIQVVLGTVQKCTCKIKCQFYSFFSLYSLRLWEDKEKSKRGRGMTIT